jgi:2-phosphosulfolactate phosphatase
LLAGAASATGVAVIIDVFRACSLVAHALAAGASRVLPVAGIEEARALKAVLPEALLAGERYAKPLPGFDCGNSPTEVLARPLAGRTIIHTTHAGTQGLTAAAQSAERVFTGAFVNAAATVAAVRTLSPTVVTLVAMGQEAREPCVEDEACAALLATRLGAGPFADSFDEADLTARLRAAPAAAKFFDPAADWAPEGDFALCAALDQLPFAVALGRSEEGWLELRRWPA